MEHISPRTNEIGGNRVNERHQFMLGARFLIMIVKSSFMVLWRPAGREFRQYLGPLRIRGLHDIILSRDNFPCNFPSWFRN